MEKEDNRIQLSQEIQLHASFLLYFQELSKLPRSLDKQEAEACMNCKRNTAEVGIPDIVEGLYYEMNIDKLIEEEKLPTKYERKCFCCDKDIEPVDIFFDSPLEIPLNTPHHATQWTTRGNFGSAVYDPMPLNSNEKLNIVICDDCLKKNESKVYVCKMKERCEVIYVKPFDHTKD